MIEQEALNVAGVTENRLCSMNRWRWYIRSSLDCSESVDKFKRNDKFYLAGYNNAPFDNQFLRAWFVQNNDKFFGSWFWSNSIDVMVMATQYLIDKRPEMENFKLSTVAKYCGIDVEADSLHDALYDITLTMKSVLSCFFNIPGLNNGKSFQGFWLKRDVLECLL